MNRVSLTKLNPKVGDTVTWVGLFDGMGSEEYVYLGIRDGQHCMSEMNGKEFQYTGVGLAEWKGPDHE